MRRIVVAFAVLVAFAPLMSSASASLAHMAAPPANDDFPGLLLDTLPTDVTTDLTAATFQPGESERLCGRTIGGTAWYTIVTAYDTDVTIKIAGQSAVTVAGVYTGDQLGDLVPIAGVNCATGGYYAKGINPPLVLTFKAVRGVAFRVRIANDTESPFAYPGPTRGVVFDRKPIGDWRPAAGMRVGRADHTATLLGDGRVLLAGGSLQADDYTSTLTAGAEIYDPELDRWISAPAMAIPRAGHSATLLRDGRVLIVGGDTPVAGGALPTEPTALAEIYDPATGRWSVTGAMGTARSHHTATLLADGRVLVVGGATPCGATTLVEVFDPALGTWAATGPLLGARMRHVAALLPDGTVLVANGAADQTGANMPAERYDPAAGAWSEVVKYGAPLVNSAATLMADGSVMVSGGLYYSVTFQSTTTATLYGGDPVAPVPLPDLAFPRSSHTATALADGRVLVAGDFEGEAELYDPATRISTPIIRMGTARVGHTATLLADGRVLLAGGFSAPAATTAELYAPPSGPSPMPTLSPGTDTVDFGPVASGADSSARTIVALNSGTAPLRLAVMAPAGPGAADFSVVDDRCTGQVIAAGTGCQVAIRFRPGAIGTRSAALTLDGGAAGIRRITLSGQGSNGTPAALPTLTVRLSGGGAVARVPGGVPLGDDAYAYPAGTVITLFPQGGCTTFTGWNVDDHPAGWANPLTITVDGSHAIGARFAATPHFPDLDNYFDHQRALPSLAARGYLLGRADGSFGPDVPVLRAQIAALIARATPGDRPRGHTLVPPACLVAASWDCEDWGNPFLDRGGLDGNLWRDVGVLAQYGVARGYGDSQFGPNDEVTYAQAISLVSRAMIARGYWRPQPAAPLSEYYSAIPAEHRADLQALAYYTSGAGGFFSLPPFAGPDWHATATRGWVAQVLWMALDSYWGRDGLLPDCRPAGGFVP